MARILPGFWIRNLIEGRTRVLKYKIYQEQIIMRLSHALTHMWHQERKSVSRKGFNRLGEVTFRVCSKARDV